MMFRGTVAQASTHNVIPGQLHLQVLANCPSSALHCVGLSVGAPTTGAAPTGYNIYKSSVSGGCSTLTATSCQKIVALTPPTLTFTDNNLAASSTFFYVATAFNATGEGPASAQQSATTGPDPVPNAPTLSIVGVK